MNDLQVAPSFTMVDGRGFQGFFLRGAKIGVSGRILQGFSLSLMVKKAFFYMGFNRL
jgi:hypothetical protein